MKKNLQRDGELTIEIGKKGGYVPVTPLGPPPQGEPLLVPQSLPATAAPADQAQPPAPDTSTPAQQSNP